MIHLDMSAFWKWWGYMSWRASRLEGCVLPLPKTGWRFGRRMKRMGLVVLGAVPSYNPLSLETVPSQTTTDCNWIPFPRFNRYGWEWVVSIMLLSFPWHVRLCIGTQFADLPNLECVTLRDRAFVSCQSVVFESTKISSPLIQTCLYCIPSYWVEELSVVTETTFRGDALGRRTTTQTCWRCGVFHLVSHNPIDLPSLTTLKGSEENFRFVGSVILESTFFWSIPCRYSPTPTEWRLFRSLQFPVHFVDCSLWYVHLSLLMIRCICPRVSHFGQEWSGRSDSFVFSVFVNCRSIDSREDRRKEAWGSEEDATAQNGNEGTVCSSDWGGRE